MDDTALFEASIAALQALPALDRLMAGRALPCLFVDEAAERILYASPAAIGLREAMADAAGRIDPELRLAQQLRGVRPLAPEAGPPRLSRLRLDPGRLSPPLVCACLQVTFSDGRQALALVPVDPLPALRPRRRAAAPGVVGAPAPPAPAAHTPAPAADAAPIRFLWRSDAGGRLVEATPSLADAVGASPVGQHWDELLAGTVLTQDDRLAAALEEHRTFRAVPVRWRLGESDQGVQVDLSGAPRLGEGRAFAGFSGFGVIHPDRVAALPPRPPASPARPRPSLRERAAAVISIGRAANPEAPSPPPGANPDYVADLPAFASLAGATLAGFAGMMASTSLNPFGLGWTFCSDPADEAGEPASEEVPPREIPASPPPGPDAPGPGEAAAAAPSEAAPEAVKAPESAPEPAGRRPLAASQLSLNEHAAFREIARALGARFAGDPPGMDPAAEGADDGAPRRGGAVTPFRGAAAPARQAGREPAGAEDPSARILDRLPLGVLVHRGDDVLFANRRLLGLAGYGTAEDLSQAGGAGALFKGRDPASLPPTEAGYPVCLATREGGTLPVAVTLTTVEWSGAPASLLLLRRLPDADPAQDLAAAELDLARQQANLREIEAVLDSMTDGVVTLDGSGRILDFNKGAKALFGHEPREVTGEDFSLLFTPDSRPAVQAALQRARSGEPASIEAIGERREGILALTVAPIAGEGTRRFSALLRDVTAARRTEAELLRAKRAAEAANSQKSDFLATISHEIRTPLNAILGFTEVMMEEQFGPIGNERYRDYLRDIRTSGEHVVSLVTDLLDLAKIEAGHLDLSFTGVALNDLVGASVSLMQPQAARQRVVVRTSFASGLKPVLADMRSMRQAALNLIANAIKFTDAGGQVIVSTAMTDRGGVALRVRDTGIGMTPDEIETALQPFRQVATAQNRRGRGTGLGLPLTKALVEANRGTLRVTSRKHEGTLVEVLFPPARVLAG
ncbi:ATP-binding protein [Methylobacterium nodulans]|uniref:histidine kinase n=1 Tax=Methylobacterium nodulans (strain LMG 21967 / CNCM I-2342 / ORS 2060) TaxID=460265 RepID=B8IK37_METNO|nr:ATP-binding protein [Methylobacterium nodulans]ACL60050.1 PAS/PAC sensor signal transduction histidine kinase [Methylobacterium nodulans ORS 2060]